MVKVRKNLTGMIFGRLTVMYQTEDYIDPKGTHYARWHCKCICGNECDVKSSHLTTTCNPIRSCGCLQKEITSKVNKRENRYDLSGEYAIGYTQKNEEYWVDKDIVPKLKLFCWRYSKAGYVIADNLPEDPLCLNKKTIFLHVFVMNGYDKNINPLNLMVDHKTHPKKPEHNIDNRRSNLRFVTVSENSRNQSLKSNNTSGVTGVYWTKRDKRWTARITVNKVVINLGSFINKNDAIKARKDAEFKYFGELRYDAYNNTTK